MKTVVRKIKNISGMSVPVEIEENTSVYMTPGETMENVNVHNLEAIRKFVSVEQDLSEILPIVEQNNRKILLD